MYVESFEVKWETVRLLFYFAFFYCVFPLPPPSLSFFLSSSIYFFFISCSSFLLFLLLKHSKKKSKIKKITGRKRKPDNDKNKKQNGWSKRKKADWNQWSKPLCASFFFFCSLQQVTRNDRQSGVQGLSLVTSDCHVTRPDVCERLMYPPHRLHQWHKIILEERGSKER